MIGRITPLLCLLPIAAFAQADIPILRTKNDRVIGCLTHADFLNSLRLPEQASLPPVGLPRPGTLSCRFVRTGYDWMSTPIDVDPDAGLVRLKLAPGTDPDGSASWFALTDMVRELRPKSAFEAAPLPALPALKFTAPLSKRQPVVDHRAWSRAPAVEKFLIRELTALDGLCRSGHGTGPHAKEACDEADDIMDYLSAAGWLYGRVTQHEADPRWWNVNTSSLPLSDRP